jgi:hypothetical protein
MIRISIVVAIVLTLFYRTFNSIKVVAFTPIQPVNTLSSPYFYQQPITDNTNHVTTTTTSDTSIHAISPWNLNREFGAQPFGFDINAEIWNGRIAQVCNFILSFKGI